jgi:hypothetical protein
MRQLVLDQRMIEDEQVRETAVLFHGGGARGRLGRSLVRQVYRNKSAHPNFRCPAYST